MKNTLTLRWDDDGHVTVLVNGVEVATTSHDEHGWDGMGAVIDTARAIAKAAGFEPADTEGTPNL